MSMAWRWWPEKMGWTARTLVAIGGEGVMCRREILHTGSLSACETRPPPKLTANPLLARLQTEPQSRVKAALDDASSTLLCDSSFWEPLVSSLRSSSPRKASLVLEWKLEQLLKEGVEEKEPYSKLIHLTSSIRNIPLALSVFRSMETKGIRPNTVIFNALITAYLSTGDIVSSSSLFEIMDRTEDCKPDSATHDAFIAFFANIGNFRAMVSWYLHKKKHGFSPTIQMYESLILGFAKLRKFDQVDSLFEEMRLTGLLPNRTILETKLEMLCTYRNLGGIRELIQFINNMGLELSEIMVERLIRLYSDIGLVHEMEALLGTVKPGTNPGILAKLHCEIIKEHAKFDRLDEMESAIWRMFEGGMVFLHPDYVEAVICSYFRREAFTRLELFLDRISGEYRFAKSSYDVLVAGYKKFRLYGKLDLTINKMKMDGFA